MRVALIDPSLFTLPYDSALLRGLTARGQDVRFFARSQRPGEAGADTSTNIEAVFYPLAESSIARRLPAAARLVIKGADHALSLARLWRLLKKWSPDAIHFQWLPLPSADLLFLPAFRRIAPVILTVHDTEAFNGNPTARLQGAGFVRALATGDRLIVHTRQGRERLIRMGIAPGRINLMPHGPLGDARQSSSDGNMNGKLTFVLFGKIKPYKGADVLIEAFAGLSPALRAQASLRIVGQPYMDVQPLQARVAALGLSDSITLELRFVADDEISAVFGAGSVAVFPYREIEASGVLSLAIGSGRPIIASRLGSFVESLHDGVHGCLVQPGDVPDLSAALARMIEDRAFAAHAAHSVCQLGRSLPSWSDIAERTISIYADARQATSRHLSTSRSIPGGSAA
jgi:glycosyltransferase involved in cell wall biosynthesis